MAKRIFHLISELDIGGTERSLVKVLSYLQSDFDNQVICAIGHGLVGKELEQAGIMVHYLHGRHRFDVAPAWRLYRLLRHEQPDALVTYLAYADIVGRIIGRLASIKKVISCQRSGLIGQEYLRWADWLTSFLIDQYVVQRQTMRVPKRPVTVIPNLVELPDIYKRRPSSVVMVTCVSNLRPGKGHVYLLQAWEKIQPQYPQAELHLVGDGPLRPSLPHPPRTIWHGRQHGVAPYLVQTDIFVLPSLAEGMSNALLEAMSYGIACIACDMAANRAVIASGEDGWLVPPADSLALAGAIEKLLGDAALRQKLGAAARRYVEQHHAANIIIPLWRKLLS